MGGLCGWLTGEQLVDDGVTTVTHGITGIPMEGTIPCGFYVKLELTGVADFLVCTFRLRAGYDDGRTPVRQEYSEERSVHTEPAVSVHGTEQTLVEEQPFTFEPEVRAAIAREFTELMKTSLPGLLAEALKKVNGEGGSSTATGAQNNETDNAPPARGCDHKSFKACDPPVLTGKKDAVATFDWVIRMEAAIRLSECRTDQVVKLAANSLREEASHWWEGVRQAKGSEVVDAMMWADLKTLVIKNFCPRNEIE
ncbi:hypothetical protein L1987_18947 [Smallanthus sonchifolius]|uniref:Uncharacterized protein n=1 Tax=Smallanthus sonchifolius TaxID=185202 RepID=A0ACB9J1L9_9ASTR|nr:hypothetical protein L1987_18947 [Smallanthus sonchifolius]